MPALSRAHDNPYDHKHRKQRAALIPAALGRPCPGVIVNGHVHHSPKCPGIMTDPRKMQLDHVTPVLHGGRDGPRRIVAAPCNHSGGAIIGNQQRGRNRHAPPTRRLPTW